MANYAELLEKVAKRDDQQSNSASIGTLPEIFKGYSTLLVRNAKDANGKTKADRATILYKKLNETTNKMEVVTVICSIDLTKLVRAFMVGMGEISGFPVFFNDKQNQFYVGMPGQGWSEQDDIAVKEWSPEAINYNKLGSAI